MGTENRRNILDAAERLMVARGHAGVTYRVLAAEAGTTAAAVQHHFRTLDDLFLALVRRRVDSHLAALRHALRTRPNEPLRVLWEFATEEATAALFVEFISLGNHRASVRGEIAQITEEMRAVHLRAVESVARPGRLDDAFLTPEMLVFLLTNIPKTIRLERTVGVSTAHAEVLAVVERFLDEVEPRRP